MHQHIWKSQWITPETTAIPHCSPYCATDHIGDELLARTTRLANNDDPPSCYLTSVLFGVSNFYYVYYAVFFLLVVVFFHYAVMLCLIRVYVVWSLCPLLWRIHKLINGSNNLFRKRQYIFPSKSHELFQLYSLINERIERTSNRRMDCGGSIIICPKQAWTLCNEIRNLFQLFFNNRFRQSVWV